MGLGLSCILAPIWAGALYDFGGWNFTTDTLAVQGFGLAAVYSLVILAGYLFIPNYWRKTEVSSPPSQAPENSGA